MKTTLSTRGGAGFLGIEIVGRGIGTRQADVRQASADCEDGEQQHEGLNPHAKREVFRLVHRVKNYIRHRHEMPMSQTPTNAPKLLFTKSRNALIMQGPHKPALSRIINCSSLRAWIDPLALSPQSQVSLNGSRTIICKDDLLLYSVTVCHGIAVSARHCGAF